MPSILLVDDDPNLRRPMSRLLQFEDYHVTEAGDGLEALQRMNEHPQDLVLLDLAMPNLDGVGFLERLRADPRLGKTPVFLLTAVHDPKPLQRAQELGIQQYLFKGDVPFSRLVEMIKQQLGQPYTPIRRGRRPKNYQEQPPEKSSPRQPEPVSEGRDDYENDDD